MSIPSAPARNLAFIHTVSGLVSEFEGLAKQHLPDWKPFAVLDESLLRDTIERGSLSDLTIRRLAIYTWSAVDAVAPLCPVPLFRIDEGMAKAAVEHGNRIGVMATLSTTLVPTMDLLKRQAHEAGKDVMIDDVLVQGAFQLLAGGDVETHNAQLRQALEELSQKVDVIVLAQASMARAVRGMTHCIPVLTSPVFGIENVKRRLEQ
ncbi:aspartate/glutamate racemase family protein (plasmid) [Rhizobium sp. WW22]|uniref:aspartate/glutamate racemase family protein n=1 Tax=Rhizobium sp. WW22 TaxID=3389070 RepID=UPI000DD73AF4